MDVVATEVKKLGGGLFIESTLNKGTRFTIRLPFTLAISQALIVRVAEEGYALPLATVEETMFRAVSVYLTAQHFRRIDGLTVDDALLGLDHIYRNLSILNEAQARRLRAAVSEAAFKDAGLNALIILDTFAQTLPMVLEDGLAVLRTSFEPFLSNPTPMPPAPTPGEPPAGR